MSYAEHGPRIFLAGRPNSGVPLTYGDYVVPKKRSEGRLKLYNSCTDIRAWSPNALECSRYFRELNEHDPAPGRVVPFNVVMENMIGLTAQAQRELRAVRRELQKYKSLRLTSEQQKYLENFDKAAVATRETEETRIEPVIRTLPQKGRELLNANIASSQNFDTYLSIYFHPYRYSKGIRNWLLTNTPVQKANLNTNPLLESNAYLVPRVMSCDILTDEKTTRDSSDHACIEYADASFQAMLAEVREVAVQTDECKNIDEYDKQSNVDSASSEYYESSESASTSESESGVNTDPEICEKNHKRVIIQKDSEIIVLKNELGMKDDELDELRELNRELQALLKEKDENANILKRNLNTMQEKLKIMKDQRNNEVGELSAKLSSTECLVDQLKAELSRKCQVCYFQSQEIQKLGKQVKEAELVSAENESLKRKVREMEHLSREAESCGVALKQVKNVWRERDMLQKQCHEQSCTLMDREDEIKRLLTLIKQMSVTADNREVEMNDLVASLQKEIQVKNNKISQCETQLVCMEREVGNLTNRLKNSLNNLDESKIAYEDICEYTKCEHDTCLDVQSALLALKAFIAELEECKLERHNRLRGIDNLKACVACYSQELSVSELTNVDFDMGRGSIQPTAEDVTSSSNYDDSSKEVINVQIQSDDVDSTTTCSERSGKVKLNEVISYEEIDRALATHIKRSIDKIHEISSVLQGAGDHHVQIVKEFARQQQELQKRDHEIAELKQKVTEHMLRRGEGDCAIQEQLRKRMLEKEKMMEIAINNRDTEIEKLHEHLTVLENKISFYRVECDTLKIENANLVELRRALTKENDARNEKLRAQREQICKLNQQIEVLKQTINILKTETENIDDMRKKLIDLEMKNNDLTNELVQANETVYRNNKIISDLKSRDEKNKLALTHESIKYDAMITQKHSDIVKLQDENQTLRDRLTETEIKLAQSEDTISLLRRECDNVAAMNALQTSLSDLDTDKEKLLAKVDYLKSEIAIYQNSTASVECELRELSRKNEELRTNIETVKSTNDQLFHEDTTTQSLKDALWTLPEKIYKRIVRIRTEIAQHIEESKSERKDETLIDIEDEKSAGQTKEHSDKACQQDEEFCTSRRTGDKLDSFAQEEDFNTENVSRRLRFLERQYEEKQQEIKSLMNNVKLRDYEIKNLQECLTYLLQEKNELQNKVKIQVEEYQSKLTIMKKKYDSSLNAFRRRHNENVEQLQARFEDIMRIEKSPFDAESWLRSLDQKELMELHNRIDIMSSRAAENGKSDDTSYTEARNHSPEEHKFFNKFTLQHTSESKTSLSRKINKKKSISKVHNIENGKAITVTELFSHDLKSKQEHRLPEKKHQSESAENLTPAKSKTDRILDRQREKFIYQCSIQHKLNNAR
ncbi:putative leucine-rich repeat-containing protein DDB_G0290503 isoform X2 [Pseudomyrmex gracilis]|uniref:putative leucine-rich repeat-containing protein DDB_G0290503 isoform X2 n=1 Tax=Pseudomyrmex gracilis TaxID=219809 RepID=UPI0009959665|nr:putative leucine-rich repeat-containing protein DDB_G0290503 isoform X2 [Pseudomyrmex gracilis]